MKTIAGIQFTENGILVTKAYVKSPETLAKLQYTEEMFEKFLEIAKRLAKARLAHCYKQLHANLANATHVTQEYIVWNNGHFSVPVWKSLEAILKLNDVRDLDALQAQQLIRANMEQHTDWAYDYDENHNLIKNSDIRIPVEFKRFITEHILVCKWNLEH